MSRQWKALAGAMVILALLTANFAVAKRASAHTHSTHWARSRPFSVSLVNWAQYSYELGLAVGNSHAMLNFSWIINGSSGDVYAIDGDWGGTGWSGLSTWDTAGGHFVPGSATARYNKFYHPDNPWLVQAVWCHELGHLWGQDHHYYDSCMSPGAGERGNTLSWHDVEDFDAVYGWHERDH